MNVGQLKKLLKGLADDTPVIVTARDHSYRHCRAFAATALFDGEHITEDHGDMTPEADYGHRRMTLIIT